MTQEAKTLHAINQWTKYTPRTSERESDYIKGYKAGLTASKYMIWAIIQAHKIHRKK